MTVTRNQIKSEDKWNVEAIYPHLNDWRKDFQTIKPNEKNDFDSLLKFQGKLGESPQTLKLALEELLKYERKLTLLYTFCHLKHDEDIADPTYKAAFDEARSTIFDFQRQISWFEPELHCLSDETIKLYLDSPILKDYRFYLERIFRMKKHVLSADKEELLALAEKGMQTPHKAFSALNDADLLFPPVLDKEGKSHDVTHGKFAVLMRSRDRVLRENTFKSYLKQYTQFENTIGELIGGAVQKNVFHAKVRNFSSALEAALYPKNIDLNVYTALIQAVRENIKPLHEYYDLRKNILGLDKIHLYDMSVPITPEFDITMDYHEAENAILEAVKPLGGEYHDILKQGLKEDKWVDKYENKNKRSGAYSSGSYDTNPYILMNYKNILRDVFTLAHEAGHSMHSHYTHKHQPYQYGDYPIFLAEVASTFNEELLMRHLLKTAKTKEEKIFLINQKLEDIRSTLYRQTMFAEFELKIHTLAENDVPLTPELLKKEYYELNQFYFGPDVIVDPEIQIEWARIPHFYYGFYVFQYATGISAALALAERVVSGGEAEKNDYLSFLKSGSSEYPVETLRKAGVDMSTSEPVKAAIGTFSRLTKELKTLI